MSLAAAESFAVLAGSSVANTGATIISGGDLGLSPGSAVTGFPPGAFTAPAAEDLPDSAQAQIGLTNAYNGVVALSGATALPADMAGLILPPGLYKAASASQLSTGTVTLDAQGDPNAVFVFQIGTTLTTAGNTQITLANGAQARNIFWAVGTSATLGTNSVFEGTIMALASITLNNGVALQGRALASVGAVTLDSNVVTAP